MVGVALSIRGQWHRDTCQIKLYYLWLIDRVMRLWAEMDSHVRGGTQRGKERSMFVLQGVEKGKEMAKRGKEKQWRLWNEKKGIKNECWQIIVEEKAKVEWEGRNDKTDARDKITWTGESVRRSEKNESGREVWLSLRLQRRIVHIVDGSYQTLRITFSISILFK